MIDMPPLGLAHVNELLEMVQRSQIEARISLDGERVELFDIDVDVPFFSASPDAAQAFTWAIIWMLDRGELDRFRK